MHGVDGDVTESQVVVEILLGTDVSSPLPDAHLEVKNAALAHRGDVQIRIQDLHVRIGFDASAQHLARIGCPESDGAKVTVVEFQGDLLEVENDVGGVFHDTGDRAEFMGDALNTNRRDRGALDRAQQSPPNGIADGGAESTLKRLRGEPAIGGGETIHIRRQALWLLKSFPH